MKTRDELDKLEAEGDWRNRSPEILEPQVRDLVATIPILIGTKDGLMTDGFAALGRVALTLDRFDVHDRSKARSALYGTARELVRRYLRSTVERQELPKGKFRKCGRGYGCSRTSKYLVSLPGQDARPAKTACWQHVDDVVGSFMGVLYDAEYKGGEYDDGEGLDGEGGGGQSIVGYRERREFDTVGDDVIVTTADLWRRLRRRIEHVRQIIPEDAPQRAALEAAVVEFESRWGAIA